MYPSLSGSNSSIINAEYSSACSFSLDSLFAEALNIIICQTIYKPINYMTSRKQST